MASDNGAIVQKQDPALEGQRRVAVDRSAAKGTQLDYLYQCISDWMDKRTSLATWYRRVNFGYQIAAAVLSGLITVITGFKSAWSLSTGASDVVLFLSALITVISVAGAFYSPKDLWVLDTVFAGNLRELQTRLRFLELRPDFETHRQEITEQGFADFERLLKDYDAEWLKIRSKGK
ncbi:SLATT domain-containing protein [Variovorax robiniae]|uniref:SLATT domain-containing protein n=1 Tax=Variovorax robiniae TaxID=1836199 RepID=A0ABU8XKH5_9BURK